MLSSAEHVSVEDAGGDLLAFVLDPENWAVKDVRQKAEYQRKVGSLRMYAQIEVNEDLEAVLRIGFFAPGLSPTKAADHLEAFVKTRLPFVPNSEWQVEIDDRRWIHFYRRYTAEKDRKSVV